MEPREEEEEDPTPTEVFFLSGCDESKCVSRGNSHLHNHSFTCYGDDDGSLFPMMCADGFLPIIIKDEPPVYDAESSGNTDTTALSLSYFTCCPPYEGTGDTDTHATRRHCSDPITARTRIDFETGNDDNGNPVCEDEEIRKHPRPMKPSGANLTSAAAHAVSFLCCDSIATTWAVDDGDDYDYNSENNNTTTIPPENFLDDLECVPYRNEFYEESKVQNEIGKLDVIFCNVSKGDFWFPRPIGEESTTTTTTTTTNDVLLASSGGRYQCCKTGPALPPFVQDSTFKITVYTTISLFWVAAILSVIVVLGLLIPLLMELYRKSNYHKRSSSRVTKKLSSIFGSRFSTSLSYNWGRSQSTHPSSNSNRSSGPRVTVRKAGKKPTYSTYNLYIVYLAFLDLIFCSYLIAEYRSYINQTFDPYSYATVTASISDQGFSNTPRDDPIIVPYMFANMWINAIVSHQVLVLLKTSQRARRINQPSLTRVNLQVGVIYFVAAIIGCALYFVYEPAWRARNNGDISKLEKLDSRMRIPIYTLLILLPSGYVIYTAIHIWWRGYIPSSKGANSRKRAMRELAFYFCRIVAVFLGIWMPRFFLVTYADASGKKWADMLAVCITAIQPILTTGMILTKSDVRNYIRDLVTLSYIFGDFTCCAKEKESQISEKEESTSKHPSAVGTHTCVSLNGNGEADGDVVEGEADGEADRNDVGMDDGDDYDAANSLVFSVLGFRLTNDEKLDSDDIESDGIEPDKSFVDGVAVANDTSNNDLGVG